MKSYLYILRILQEKTEKNTHQQQPWVSWTIVIVSDSISTSHFFCQFQSSLMSCALRVNCVQHLCLSGIFTLHRFQWTGMESVHTQTNILAHTHTQTHWRTYTQKNAFARKKWFSVDSQNFESGCSKSCSGLINVVSKLFRVYFVSTIDMFARFATGLITSN